MIGERLLVIITLLFNEPNLDLIGKFIATYSLCEREGSDIHLL